MIHILLIIFLTLALVASLPLFVLTFTWGVITTLKILQEVEVTNDTDGE